MLVVDGAVWEGSGSGKAHERQRKLEPYYHPSQQSRLSLGFGLLQVELEQILSDNNVN